MKTIKILSVLFTISAFIACSDDGDDVNEPKGAYEFGYFIINEGPFQNGSGTITFVGDDGTVEQEVYKSVNGKDLGNIVNSMHIDGDVAYIVVNNSSRIVVVDRNTMEELDVIEGNGVDQPRHFVAVDGTGYVSNWGDPFDPSDDFISIIDLATNEVQGTIPVGEGPERMLETSEGLFVALQGGYGQNNQVMIIDTSVNQVKGTLTVGDVPNSLNGDGSGNVWVLCGGKPAFTQDETPGALYRVQLSDLSTSSQEFGQTDHPSMLNLDSGQLFYHLNGQIYAMSAGAAELPMEALSGLDGFYYSMKVQDGELFATDAKDFNSEGEMKVFSVNSGALLNTVQTGIIPGQVVFP